MSDLDSRPPPTIALHPPRGDRVAWEYLDREPVPRPAQPPPRPRRRRRWLPPLLYVLTFASTYLAGGPVFAVAVMLILTAHELGHYFQAVRYRVRVSLPYFIPMPISPFGTMGAVIRMQANMADARALFDIAITGPIAGLVPAVVASAVGLTLSTPVPVAEVSTGFTLQLGEPLIFKGLSLLLLGPLPEGTELLLHPLAYAGWVGIFVTALNLIPIGQLDGGHILYALLRRRAHFVSLALLLGALVGILVAGYWGWTLLLALLIFFGPFHPPTADDSVPLGWKRKLLGWLMLLFLIIGFTPNPLIIP